MIFGKSSREKRKIKSEKNLQKILGVREFAWFPTRLADGRKIWFEYYYAYYSGGMNDDGTYFLLNDVGTYFLWWSVSSSSHNSDNYLDPQETDIRLIPLMRCAVVDEKSMAYASSKGLQFFDKVEN
jgi:hypothetical protein